MAKETSGCSIAALYLKAWLATGCCGCGFYEAPPAEYDASLITFACRATFKIVESASMHGPSVAGQWKDDDQVVLTE